MLQHPAIIHTSLKVLDQNRPWIGIVRWVYMEDEGDDVSLRFINVNMKPRGVAIQTKPVGSDRRQRKANPLLGIFLQLVENSLRQIGTVDEPRARVCNSVNMSFKAGSLFDSLSNCTAQIHHQRFWCSGQSKSMFREIFLHDTSTQCLREPLKAIIAVLNFFHLTQPMLEQLSPSRGIGSEFFRWPGVIELMIRHQSFFFRPAVCGDDTDSAK